MHAQYGFRATMTAAPGKIDELVALLLSAVRNDGPATNPHCVLYLVSRANDGSDVVCVTEGWTSKQAHADNFASAAARTLVQKLSPLVTSHTHYGEELPLGGKFSLESSL